MTTDIQEIYGKSNYPKVFHLIMKITKITGEKIEEEENKE